MNKIATFFLLGISILLTGSLLAQTITALPTLQNNLKFAEISEANGVALIGGLETYKSTNGGYTWTELDDSFGSNLYPYETYGAAIITPTTYCLLGKNVLNNTYSILRTIDGGNSWTVHLNSTTSTTPKYLDIDYNGTSIVVTAAGGIYRSLDNGLSWTYHIVGGGSVISPFIQHNTSNNEWMCGTYNSDYSISANNGSSWVNQPIPPYISSNTTNASNRNGEILLTSNLNGTNQFTSLNTSYGIQDSIHIGDQYFHGGTTFNAFSLSNNKIFTYANQLFYLIDTVSGYVHQYTDTLVDQNTAYSIINDVDIDQTYGLAVGNWGSISRIDLSQNPNLIVPAEFSIVSAINCPGDVINAQADFPFADSIQWFYDGNYISNDSILNFNSPIAYGTFPLEMRSWLDGNFTTSTQDIIYNPPLPPHSYGVNLDSVLCHGESIDLTFYQLPGSSVNTHLEIFYGNQSIYPNQTLPTSTFTFTTPQITQEDTLWIITNRPQLCGTTGDTSFFTIDVGDDLQSVTLLPNDSVVCSGTPIAFDLINSVDGASYNLSRTNSSIFAFSENLTTTGVSNDTIHLLSTAPDINTNTHSSTFVDVFVYYNLDIVNTDGCTHSIDLDTIRIQRSTAAFLPHSRSYYLGDTVKLSNIFPTENRLWQQSNYSGLVQNETDTVPLIIPEANGLYTIELLNNPLPGCSDSTAHWVFYCDSLPTNNDSICSVEHGSTYRQGLSSKLDPFGNTYMVGYYIGNSSPYYIVTKYAPSGTLLWQKKAPTGSFSAQGCMVTDLDFDINGDVYISIWAQSNNSSYSSDWISVSNDTKCGIAKINGNNGSLIWFKDVSTFPNITVIANNTRTTSVAISGDKLHFVVSESTKMQFGATDLQGNFISGSNRQISGSPGLVRASGPYSQYMFSPRLKSLKDGKVMAVGIYDSSEPGPAFPELEGTYQSGAVFACEYSSNLGIQHLTKVAEIGHSYNSSSTSIRNLIPYFAIDSAQNLLVGIEWLDGHIKVMDSVIVQPTGSALIKLDSNYDLDWVSLGSYAFLTGLKVAKQSNEIILGGLTRTNVSYGVNNEYFMTGIHDTTTHTFSEIPSAWFYLNELYQGYDSGFAMKFGSNGVPQDALNFQIDAYLTPGYKFTSTPCGDLQVLINNKVTSGPPYSIYIDANQYLLDSTLVINYSPNCHPSNCSLICLQDSISICKGDTSFTLPAQELFNVSTIHYSIYEGAIQYVNDSIIVSAGNMEIPIPSGINSDFMVVFSSPVQDTLYVYVNPIPVTAYSYTNTICDGYSVTINASPTSYSYQWNGLGLSGSSVNLTSNNYNTGNNQYVIDVTSINGCSITDTIDLFVNTPVTPQTQQNYFVTCNDTLIVPLDNASFTTQDWMLNGIPAVNQFTSNNLNTGLNFVQLIVTDTNGCQSTVYFQIDYCNTGIDPISQTNLQLVPNPNDGNFNIIFGAEQQQVEVVISNPEGKIVKRYTDQQVSTLDFSLDITAGIYIVNIKTPRQSVSKKIVIK